MWVMVNFYVVNTLIALIELFFFSSIRCDQVSYFPQVPAIELNHWQPVSVHTAWGFITGILLVGWLYLGHYLTGEYIYFFLDLGAYPPNKVAAMVLAFITLVETGEFRLPLQSSIALFYYEEDFCPTQIIILTCSSIPVQSFHNRVQTVCYSKAE